MALSVENEAEARGWLSENRTGFFVELSITVSLVHPVSLAPNLLISGWRCSVLALREHASTDQAGFSINLFKHTSSASWASPREWTSSDGTRCINPKHSRCADPGPSIAVGTYRSPAQRP